MITIDVEKISNTIPIILNYIAPGFIFFTFKNFYIENNKKNDNNNSLISFIIISYLFNISFGKIIDINSKFYPFMLIIIPVTTAIVFVNFIDSKEYNKIFGRVKLYRNLRDDLISDVIDSEYGMWLRIYLEKEKIIYTGILTRYENETRDGHRYILLSSYSVHSYDGVKVSAHDGKKTECVLLNISNIDRIEMIYDENSNKI